MQYIQNIKLYKILYKKKYIKKTYKTKHFFIQYIQLNLICAYCTIKNIVILLKIQT